MSQKSRLTVGVDEPLSLSQSLLLGIQHVLAMDVYVVPFIIATAIGLSTEASASLIQATFLAAGIGTIIQTFVFMKIPIAQGPSFIPIGAIAGFLYWKFVGCHSGSCPITSHWYTSAFAGSLFGYLAGSIIADYVKKPAGK